MAEKRGSRISTSEVLSIFPTFVWKTRLKQQVYKTINKDILKKLDELTQSIPELLPGQSWQSDQSLHKLPQLRDLISCINTTTKSVLEFLEIAYDA